MIRTNPPLGAGRRALRVFSMLAVVLLGPSFAEGQEGATPPHWIWHPSPTPGNYPGEARYFRKAFRTREPNAKLTVAATADNGYVLYLDGKEIARGDDWHRAEEAKAVLSVGDHVLAAMATNEAPGAAGFLLRGSILPLGQGIPIHTNATWKSTDKAPTDLAWTKPGFDDSGWSKAFDLGALGVEPWGNVTFEDDDGSTRFKVPQGFKVSMAAPPKVTGSAVAMTFDPEGRPCVSIERGPIARLIDKDKDGTYEESLVIAPQMNNCQGLSFIKGFLFAVGEGPGKKTGLHRLSDADGDGVFEKAELVRGTEGGMGEHGPHAVNLGPDGCLYYNGGNHSHLAGPIDPKSPVNDAFKYEGELLPHYNDARGHAAGIMAPGGEIYRSDDDGKTWKRVVAGFRNEYDFAFNRRGEIFSFDSDMEWDIGLPWYRPVRVTFCPPGAEFGWRNGSGKWPTYYFDSLPAVLDLGRGSPTGVTFYQGNKFPKDYDDNFLICDWSQGRILAIGLTPKGASYEAKARELVTGQPLNCTDLEVGPDGALYFTTGGRGTLGGLYRVEWNGSETPTLLKPDRGKPDLLRDAIAMDSPLSAYSQHRLLNIKKSMGLDWETKLSAVALDQAATPKDRIRALDLLTQFGPAPADDFLIGMTVVTPAEVASKAIDLLGAWASDTSREALIALLPTDHLGLNPILFRIGAPPGDRDGIYRHVCEALVRTGRPTPIDKLVPLLNSDDRFVRYAARVAIEHGDMVAHRDKLLSLEDRRARIEGMLALVRATKIDAGLQDDILGRARTLLDGIRVEEMIDLMRLVELTYLLGPKKPMDCPASAVLARMLSDIFRESSEADAAGFPEPEKSAPILRDIRRESARLLAYLDDPKAIPLILKAQAETPDHATQIHYTYCLRNIKSGWTDADKRQLWAWYETASHWDGGYSFLGYLDVMAQELVSLLTPEERSVLLAQGEKYPFPTRVLVRSIDLGTQPERIADLSSLYARLEGSANSPAASELRGLVLEGLGKVRDPKAHAALREMAKADPGRRDLVARALADHPTAEDLPILVSALDSRDVNTTRSILPSLARLDARPEGPEGIRALIRLAQRSGPTINGPLNAIAARWTGTKAPSGDFAANLKHWEELYASRYPSGPALYEAASPGQTSYTLSQLVADVVESGRLKKASTERGKVALKKAKCLECHKLGDQGAGLGPDLTTISSRFRPAEILESILEPSKVISDQYKPITIATTDGKIFNGMPTGSEPDKIVLLLSDGTKATILKKDVEDQKESKVSVMPEGLLNGLTVEEIADMIALFEAQPRVEVKK